MNCLVCQSPLQSASHIFISCEYQDCQKYDLNYQIDNGRFIDICYDLRLSNDKYIIIQKLFFPFTISIESYIISDFKAILINYNKILMPEELKKKLPSLLVLI